MVTQGLGKINELFFTKLLAKPLLVGHWVKSFTGQSPQARIQHHLVQLAKV
jgi:hypothetical protein